MADKGKKEKKRPSLVELAEELGPVMSDLPEEPQEIKTGEAPVRKRTWFKRWSRESAWGAPPSGPV